LNGCLDAATFGDLADAGYYPGRNEPFLVSILGCGSDSEFFFFYLLAGVKLSPNLRRSRLVKVI